jgi:hypothetical protein
MPEPTDIPTDASAADAGSASSTTGLDAEQIEDAMAEADEARSAASSRDDLPHPHLIEGPAAASATGVGTDDLDAAVESG